METSLSPSAPHLFRLRVVLRFSQPVALPVFHGPVVYGLLARANGLGGGGPASFPEQVFPEIIENTQAVSPGDGYAIGLRLVCEDAAAAGAIAARLLRGLEMVGNASAGAGNGGKFSGNFKVAAVEDLVAARPWPPSSPCAAVPPAVLAERAQAIAALSAVVVQFVTPLRCHRPKDDPGTGHGYFDAQYFDFGAFIRRLHGRLSALGLVDLPPGLPLGLGGAVVGKQLRWLDTSYGPPERRKALGGVVGTVTMAVAPALAVLLAMGEFVGAGENTRFGLGQYRIRDLPPLPYRCAGASGQRADPGAVAAAGDSAATRRTAPAVLTKALR